MDLDELARDFQAHNAEVKSRLDEANASIDLLRKGDPNGKMGLDGITALLGEMEQRMARRAGPDGAAIEVKSMGAQLVASKGYKDFMAAGGKGQVRIEVKSVSNLGSMTTGEGGLGGLVAPDRQAPTPMPMRSFTVRSLLRAGNTESNLIQVPVQTQRNLNAAVVPEGTLKPQSDFTYELVNFPVTTVAHVINASRQILDDAPVLQATIDAEMRYGLQFKEDQELLFGTGLNGDLAGMTGLASPYAEAFTPTGETPIDRLRLAALQTRLALYPPTGFILNPTDWARIQLTKDTQGRYIFGDPQAGGVPQMWGLPVAEADAMPAGSFLTGAFGLAAQIFDRLQAEVLISTENQDNFIRNMITVRAEERLALVVRRPAALVYGTLVAGATAGTVAA